MIKLKGHETFAIREGWLSKGLIEVDKNEKVFSKNFGAHDERKRSYRIRSF